MTTYSYTINTYNERTKEYSPIFSSGVFDDLEDCTMDSWCEMLFDSPPTPKTAFSKMYHSGYRQESSKPQYTRFFKHGD